MRSWFLLFLVPVLAVVAGRCLRAHRVFVCSGHRVFRVAHG